MRTWPLTVAWVSVDPPGVEFAEVALEQDRLRASGVAIRSGPVLYRLDFRLKTAKGFVTSNLRVEARGQGWRRELDLRRSRTGTWTATASAQGDVDLPDPGGDLSGLADALDCDLGLSPLTNTLPILRRGLLDGAGPAEMVMAWVSVPDLSVHVARQRYTPGPPADQGHRVVRYEDAGGDFAAELTLDEHGLVVEYPGLAHRLDGNVAVDWLGRGV